MSKAPLRDEIDAHMSIAGGLHLPPLAADAVRAFLAARRRTRIRFVFAHASYLIN